MLSNIDIDGRLTKLKKDAVGTKGQKLNTFNKEMRYLKALKNNNLKPEEAYVVSKVPVLPPKFRPIYPLDNGSLITSDVNLLYKDVFLANEAIKEKRDLGLPEESLSEDRQHLYSQYKAMAGLGGAADSAQPGKRAPAGLMESITGRGSPKGSFFQSKLVRKRQDVSGRSTIIPEPQLSVDEVGIPKKMLQTLYRKPVIRRLVKLGYTPLQAKEAIDKDSQVAMKALELEAESRPVLLNRAPTLHKFSMMAFKPKITKGKAIKLHPLVVGGFNPDFDGDAMAVHAPVTDAVVKEALKMLPTNNLFNPGTGDLMVLPGQEAVLGLYNLTEQGKKTNKSYKDFGSVQADLKEGKINATDQMTIAGVKTTPGRYLVNSLLPEEHRDFKSQYNKKKLVQLMNGVAQSHPSDFGRIADGLKDIGNEHAYRSGATITLDDVQPMVKTREALLNKVRSDVNKINEQLSTAKSKKDKDALNAKKIELYQSITPDISNALKSLPRANNVFRMIDSGARGNMTQMRQMVSAPMLLTDTVGNTVPVPVTRSYAEGLDSAGYFIQSYGARKGAVDRSLQTSVPGYYSKRIINTMIDTTVTIQDCGTKRGALVPLEESLDRYTAGVNMGIQPDTLVTSRVLDKYKKKGKEKIRVRSPMYCEAKEGICSKCFGKRETGRDSDIGDNIGTISAQAIAEPATQMQMRTFHTGGVAEGGIGGNLKSGFERILQMTDLPSTIRGSSVLSEADGKVDQISPAPAGGFFVHVANMKHYVPASQRVEVEEGQRVTKGDALSTGEKNPHDLLRLKGMDYTRDYLSREIRDEYRNQGIRIKPNIVDTMVRSLTNLTRIDDPGDTDWVPGDYAPLAVVEKRIEEGSKITHRPELKGINQAALYGNEDWLSHLNFQGLKKTVVNAATKGWSSSIHGTNPIAAWAYGAEFGKGEKPGTY
jgi:DNA-directed RNA polymerase subunit beta'